MKPKMCLAIVAVALLSVLCLRPLWSGDEKPKADEPPMPDWMKTGPENEQLAKVAGKYDVAGKFWEDPSKDPVESKGSAEFTSIMGGRFVQQTFAGKMMGMDYTGLGVDGFDRITKKYTSYWCDSMSTSSMYMTGESKDGGKTIEYGCEMTDPDSKKTMKIRAVHTQKSADEFLFEMFGTADGKEVKFFELTYTRKK